MVVIVRLQQGCLNQDGSEPYYPIIQIQQPKNMELGYNDDNMLIMLKGFVLSTVQ